MPIKVEFIPVNSSNIKAIGHHLVEGLFVDFHSGKRYRYAGVPADVFDALVKEGGKVGGSVGKLFSKSVRSAGYEYEEVQIND